ncbi:remorin [Tanacetum coccineum]
MIVDRYTNEVEVEPNFMKFECLEPLSESFVFKDEVKSSRDIGTEMTPLGSSTTSRCPTPLKALSPPRHNTPASRSGPLVVMDPNTCFNIGELQECHLAKMKLETPFDSGVSNWSSREEEEEDISKSLRHFEMSNECRKSISESRACAWEEEEKTKCCLRYQREEAKIQAWVDLQNANAEAQSRKLEVKIQKMRSKFEEKVMRKMAIVHRKAEELRTAAQLEHTEQMQKATEQANKTMNQHISQYRYITSIIVTEYEDNCDTVN